jgi:DNA-binding response OmpR family regulator
VLDDREPEPGAARAAGRVSAVEALEQPRHLLLVYADAVVTRDEEPVGHFEVQGRAVARVADGVLGEVLDEHAEHARAQRQLCFADRDDLDPGARRAVRERGHDLVDDRARVRRAEGNDLTSALELRQEQDLVDQRAGALDLGACLVDKGMHVGTGQRDRVEEREDPRERRSQLVRHRGREAGAELVEAAVVHQIVTIPKPWNNVPRDYRRDVARVLIIEDDNVIADGMARHLQAGGFDPVVVGRGELGLARLRFENPDVCVLDLMLPGLDGWKLIETARAEGIGTPIVVVSARGTEHDRVHALEIGADDYLVKPFSMRELVARVAAAARRGVRPAEEKRGDAIEIEELRIDPREVQAFVDGRSAELTPTEFKLLYTLALDRGRVVTRDELLQKVWGRRETHRDRTVDVFVRRLRQKIDREASRHSFIQTRFGVGYKLEPEPK